MTKLEEWIELKKRMPEVTRIAEELKEAFGCKAIGIKDKTGLVFRAGVFDKPKDLSVKKYNKYYRY